MGTLISSNVSDYQVILKSIFEAFATFLLTQPVSEITRKNYRSDLRHFFTWLAQTQSEKPVMSQSPKSFLAAISNDRIEAYKRHLLLSNVPLATINRRLSSLRMLFRFAQREGWIAESPTNLVRNVVGSEPEIPPETMLSAFGDFLSAEGASKTTIKSYVNDVAEFLTWLAKRDSQPS